MRLITPLAQVCRGSEAEVKARPLMAGISTPERKKKENKQKVTGN